MLNRTETHENNELNNELNMKRLAGKTTKQPNERVISGQTHSNEPSHEIMTLFVLRKLILQTRMRSHPVGLDV